MAPAASAAAMSRPMSPTSTHRSGAVPSAAAASCTSPGAGLRQAQPSSSACGQICQVVERAEQLLDPGVAPRAICRAVNRPRASPDWLVTTPSAEPGRPQPVRAARGRRAPARPSPGRRCTARPRSACRRDRTARRRTGGTGVRPGRGPALTPAPVPAGGRVARHQPRTQWTIANGGMARWSPAWSAPRRRSAGRARSRAGRTRRCRPPSRARPRRRARERPPGAGGARWRRERQRRPATPGRGDRQRAGAAGRRHAERVPPARTVQPPQQRVVGVAALRAQADPATLGAHRVSDAASPATEPPARRGVPGGPARRPPGTPAGSARRSRRRRASAARRYAMSAVIHRGVGQPGGAAFPVGRPAVPGSGTSHARPARRRRRPAPRGRRQPTGQSSSGTTSSSRKTTQSPSARPASPRCGPPPGRRRGRGPPWRTRPAAPAAAGPGVVAAVVDQQHSTRRSSRAAASADPAACTGWPGRAVGTTMLIAVIGAPKVARRCTANGPSASRSTGAEPNSSIASRGVSTIGRPAVFSEVLTTTGRPVRRSNSASSSATSGSVSACDGLHPGGAVDVHDGRDAVPPLRRAPGARRACTGWDRRRRRSRRSVRRAPSARSAGTARGP